MKSSFFAAIVCSALASAACTSGGSSAPEPNAPADDAGAEAPLPLAWGPCDTKDWPDGFALPAAGVVCTTVTVPFDHAHPDDGRTIGLRVARKSAQNASRGAVFQLAGGPGGTSVGQSGTIPKLMPKLGDDFDLVYVDQRGTGGSGYLGCASGYPETKDDWIACAAEHAKDDLAHYLTVDAAHDLDGVRKALGYTKVGVRAGSYGTRLGLELLRQHPEGVLAIVLDGVDPPDSTFFHDFIRAPDRGVERLIADCTKSTDCQAITKDLRADLEAYRAAVVAKPRTIVVGGLSTQEDETAFLQALSGALFEASTYFELPRAIHGAASGDFAAWDAVMGAVFGQTVTEPTTKNAMRRTPAPTPPPSVLRPLRRTPVMRTHGQSYVAPGLYMNVLCSEDLPFEGGLDALRQFQAEQKWGGDPNMIDIAEACAAWKVTPIDASLRAPVRADLSVLLLDGDLDLNTFPEYGAHAKETLSHATDLVVPFATHSTMSIPCVGGVITSFLAQGGDMSKVDASCVGGLSAPPW